MIIRYRVLDAASKSRDGFLEAEDLDTARRGLELQGLFVVDLGEADPSILEELAKQRAAEEAAKPPPPPPGSGPTVFDRLQAVWNLPATRTAFRVALALGAVLIVVQTFRAAHRPPAARPEPVAHEYRFKVKGAVTPGDCQLAFILPEIPVQFDRRQSQIKSGPDGAFATELSFASAREPKTLVVRVEHEGYAPRTLQAPLHGDVISIPSVKLVAAEDKPEPKLTADQQRRLTRMAELKELAKKREAARLLIKRPERRVR